MSGKTNSLVFSMFWDRRAGYIDHDKGKTKNEPRILKGEMVRPVPGECTNLQNSKNGVIFVEFSHLNLL